MPSAKQARQREKELERQRKEEERKLNNAKKAKEKTDGKKREALLLPLLPYSVLMKAILRKKGIDTKGMSIKETLVSFINVVLKKPEFAKQVEASFFDSLDIQNYDELDTFDPVTIGTIVLEVINKIKQAIDKKKKQKAGEAVNLTDEEKEIADEAEKEPDLEEKAKKALEEAKKTVDKLQDDIEENYTKAYLGDIVYDNIGLILVAIVFLLMASGAGLKGSK